VEGLRPTKNIGKRHGENFMDKNDNAVLKAMKKAAKPLKPGEIAEMAGMDKDEVAKIIKKLQTDGAVTSPKRCYYQAK